MRVVHYLNQFFGGIGGEEKADVPPQVRRGAVGPARLLEMALPDGSQVIATVICGDNYAAENSEEVRDAVVAAVQQAEADLLIAGPCFVAGRYGTAAGGVCAAVLNRLDVPAIAAMAQENPGADLHRSEILIVDSGTGPSGSIDRNGLRSRKGCTASHRCPSGSLSVLTSSKISSASLSRTASDVGSR